MKPTSMCVVAMFIVLTGLCLSRPVAAQPPDQYYGEVKRFPSVYVTDALGRETKGRLVNWTGSQIVLQTEGGERVFKPGEAVRLDLRGDSLKNGALIGLTVGVVMGALAGAGCDCGGGDVAIMLFSGGIYTLMGVGIDALVPGRTPMWNAGQPAQPAQPAQQRSARNGLMFRVSPERRSAFLGWRIK
jgi:hypothetical protein